MDFEPNNGISSLEKSRDGLSLLGVPRRLCRMLETQQNLGHGTLNIKTRRERTAKWSRTPRLAFFDTTFPTYQNMHIIILLLYIYYNIIDIILYYTIKYAIIYIYIHIFSLHCWNMMDVAIWSSDSTSQNLRRETVSTIRQDIINLTGDVTSSGLFENGKRWYIHI